MISWKMSTAHVPEQTIRILCIYRCDPKSLVNLSCIRQDHLRSDFLEPFVCRCRERYWSMMPSPTLSPPTLRRPTAMQRQRKPCSLSLSHHRFLSNPVTSHLRLRIPWFPARLHCRLASSETIPSALRLCSFIGLQLPACTQPHVRLRGTGAHQPLRDRHWRVPSDTPSLSTWPCCRGMI